MIAPALTDALDKWLAQERALNGAANNTIRAYQADLLGFLGFMGGHHGGQEGLGPLSNLSVSDMRAWMAHERGRGVGARSLARSLSAVKSFYRWLSEREGFEPTAVLSTRAPRFHKKLPRPVAEDAARHLIDRVSANSETPWVSARDTAIVTLLYGCGLRISEALALPATDADLPDVLRIVGKGGKERIVPVIDAAKAATRDYARLCPHDLGDGGPLFRGVRGKALNPRAVQKSMEQARIGLGLPATTTPHAMRHSFATHLLSAGGDLRAIQELLGHASLSTTQAYTAVDTAHLMEVYSRAPPKADGQPPVKPGS